MIHYGFPVDVPLESIEEEWRQSGLASSHLKMIADHYGIFTHLFGDAYFYPRVMLDIEYVQKDNSVVPVYRGNIIKPREVRKYAAIINSYELTPIHLMSCCHMSY